MFIASKCLLVQIVMGLGLALCCVSCTVALPNWKPFPTPVLVTPTPHYVPMVGYAYTDGITPLFKSSDINGPVIASVPADVSRVEILESVWHYTQGRYGDEFCYVYHICIPDTQTEGWLPQDWITQEKGKEVPVEQRCFQGGQPTSTPPYAPLTGSVYINVGVGYGVAGSYTYDPRAHTQFIFAHGVQVDIMTPRWVHYAATETSPELACYVYAVIVPSSLTKTWLPEDVLAKELTDTPQSRCFPDRPPPSILNISPTPPEGYELITPEPELP